MTFAYRMAAHQIAPAEAPVAVANDLRVTVQARIISQIERALYPVLITDESDPEDQAKKRSQVAKAAHAAWMQFQASQSA
jgi:hypothetical protein